MLISEKMTYFHVGKPILRRRYDDVSDQSVEDSPESSIPHRYRDGMGGIDLEKVRQDQCQARREFVRAMIRSLEKLRRH